jgi:hypothetical protein
VGATKHLQVPVRNALATNRTHGPAPSGFWKCPIATQQGHVDGKGPPRRAPKRSSWHCSLANHRPVDMFDAPIPYSSMVERAAVNRQVAGSSPAGGVSLKTADASRWFAPRSFALPLASSLCDGWRVQSRLHGVFIGFSRNGGLECIVRLERTRHRSMPPIERRKVPPPKTCASCHRPFTWRKKWERDWEQVRYCSDACRRTGPRAGPVATVTPSGLKKRR